MVKLTLPENSRIVEGKAGKKVKIQYALMFTDGTEKTKKPKNR